MIDREQLVKDIYLRILGTKPGKNDEFYRSEANRLADEFIADQKKRSQPTRKRRGEVVTA